MVATAEWHSYKIIGKLGANAILLELNVTVTITGNP